MEQPQPQQPTPAPPPQQQQQQLLLNFRPPSSFTSQPSATTSPTPSFTAPTPDWIAGKWYVTHSSLPMWKTRRNVAITYTPLQDPPGAFDNLVEYQSLEPSGSDSVSTVRGIEKMDARVEGAWNWRGKGWLVIASSSWEVLGWGSSGEDAGNEKSWMVIYFRKTLFTPAGVDLLSREDGKRSEDDGDGVFEMVRERMRRDVEVAAGGDEGLGKCVEGMFRVKHDL